MTRGPAGVLVDRVLLALVRFLCVVGAIVVLCVLALLV
jgi:hypothetical protein